jgi:hypothetical protein
MHHSAIELLILRSEKEATQCMGSNNTASHQQLKQYAPQLRVEKTERVTL